MRPPSVRTIGCNGYQHTMSEARLKTDAKMNDYFNALTP